MTPNELRYVVNMTNAERVLEDYMARVEARSPGVYRFHCCTIRLFLDNVGEAAERAPGHFVLDAPGILRWTIEDSRGRSLTYACQRIAAIGHYLQELFKAGLIGVDVLGEFKLQHGNRSWACITKAIQSADPAAALAALKPPPQVPGPLHVFVKPFIELGRSGGKKYEDHVRILQDLDQFLASQSVPCPQAVSRALVEEWLKTMTCSSTVRVNKARFVRRFFEHLRCAEVVPHNPVDVTLTCRARTAQAFRPFIFTTEQMALILAESRRLPKSHTFPLRRQTCYAMLAVLYAIGLRHGEARRLRICDVDFRRDTLFINQTKFYKSRYVPFGPKLGRCLREYLDDRRATCPPARDEDPFFVTSRRGALGELTLLRSFRVLLETVGIVCEGRRRPRLHDLRHTFAVHRLLRWYREGVNVQQRLPWLSTFMGHVDILSTQVYLTITTDLLKEANTRFYQHCGRLLAEEGTV